VTNEDYVKGMSF